MPPFVDALHLPLPSPLRPIFHQQSLDRVNVIYFTHKGAMINGLLWQRYITTPLKKCKHTRSRLNLIQTRSNPADITLIVHSTSVFDMCALARIGSPIELFIPGLSPTFVRKKSIFSIVAWNWIFSKYRFLVITLMYYTPVCLISIRLIVFFLRALLNKMILRY